MSLRFQRLLIILSSLIFLTGSILLILFNSKKNLIFFYTPSELIDANIEINKIVRIGGYVKIGSIINTENNFHKFIITDKINTLLVEYNGILPDLFNEGQGAVIEGVLINKKKINAHKVFAKHDENYMPASIKKQLENTQYWKNKYK